MTRPISEYREALKRNIQYHDPDHLALEVALDELEQAREHVRVLRAALEQFTSVEDGCINACGNGGEDPEDCSPLCAKVRSALAATMPKEGTT